MERVLHGQEGPDILQIGWAAIGAVLDVLIFPVVIEVKKMMQMPRVPRLTDGEVASTPEQKASMSANITVFLRSKGYKPYLAVNPNGVAVQVWATSLEEAEFLRSDISFVKEAVAPSSTLWSPKDIVIGGLADLDHQGG